MHKVIKKNLYICSSMHEDLKTNLFIHQSAHEKIKTSAYLFICIQEGMKKSASDFSPTLFKFALLLRRLTQNTFIDDKDSIETIQRSYLERYLFTFQTPETVNPFV